MRLIRAGVLVVLAGVAGTGCSAGSSAVRSFVSASAWVSAGPVLDSKGISSPAGSSAQAVMSEPQVYVTAAQLLNADDGAMVVKDCPAQGRCAFRLDVTSDGGATWRRGSGVTVADLADSGSPSSADPIVGLAMVSGTDIFAYGSSVWHTTDAGATWTQLPAAPAVDTWPSATARSGPLSPAPNCRAARRPST
jgi:hypothetical protein